MPFGMVTVAWMVVVQSAVTLFKRNNKRAAYMVAMTVERKEGLANCERKEESQLEGNLNHGGIHIESACWPFLPILSAPPRDQWLNFISDAPHFDSKI